MSKSSINSYKKNRRKQSLPKIEHVYGTEKEENIWIVKINGKKHKISQRFIKKNNLITDNTTWTVDRLGVKFRYNIGDERRFVFWKGFTTPSIEPGDFSPQVIEASDEDEEDK